MNRTILLIATGILLTIVFVVTVSVLAFTGNLDFIFSRTRVYEQSDGSVLIKGVVTLKEHETVDVHYPVRFEHLPDFQMLENYERVYIIEHRRDGFIIKNVSSYKSLRVPWEAKGFPDETK